MLRTTAPANASGLPEIRPAFAHMLRDPALRAVFERAERDTPPEALGVATLVNPELHDGAAAVREPETV